MREHSGVRWGGAGKKTVGGRASACPSLEFLFFSPLRSRASSPEATAGTRSSKVLSLTLWSH